MTAETFQPPLPTFTGLDGQPLSGGFVYFGTVGQDPEQSPIAVYWDEAMTQVATQPLRTTAGYVYRNGTPATVWVASSCSIRVRDAQSRQVFYVAEWETPAVAVATAEAAAIARIGQVTANLYTNSNAAASRGGVIALMFDDGYQSNHSFALPILAQYGFAATLAVESQYIGATTYGGGFYTMCTASNLRDLVDAGWEVCNHPALVLANTEAQMVTAARTENELIVDVLTGAKVMPGNVPAAVTHPQYEDYPIETAVLQGGARNATSDLAFRFLFDKVRSIPGAVATSGDYLMTYAQHQERQMGCTAFVIDTTAASLVQSLAFIEGVAQTGARAILYAHHTPSSAPGGGAAPYILASELETLMRRCHELGVQVVPLRNLYRANAIADKTFEDSTGSFSARVGDTAGFVTVDTLHGATRAVELVSSAGVANTNTYYQTANFVCEPFTRYKITIRHKIDVDLALTGGVGNRNHGLNVGLLTTAGNTAQDGGGQHEANNWIQNDAVSRIPYLATTGYGSYEVTLCTGNGTQASVKCSLYACTGTAKIGAIYVEKMESLLALPLTGTNTFNTSLGRAIFLPAGLPTGARGYKWDVRIVAAPIDFGGTTLTYAANDPAAIGAPVNGDTCYVTGPGVGAFAGRGGQIATYNGAAWATFGAATNGTVYLVSTFMGSANFYVRHIAPGGTSAPVFEVSKAASFEDPGFYKESSGSVFNKSGLRSDAFTWYARPVPSGFN